MLGRASLLALLVYVTLDLSLPAMPGAFVFDAADSVESTQNRGRHSVHAVPLTAPAPDAPRVRVSDTGAGRGPRIDADARARRPEHPLARAALSPTQSTVRSDDPH